MTPSPAAAVSRCQATAKANDRDIMQPRDRLSIVDPNVANPQSWQWERTFPLFDLLL